MVKEVFKVKVLTFDYFTFIADIKCREIDGFDAQVGTCHTTFFGGFLIAFIRSP